MSTKTKLIIGVVATVVMIGAWVGLKSFTGSEMGGTCNGDGDCKGMDAVCVIGDDNTKYCTVPCTAPTDCPAGYTCGTVGVTNVSGTGEMTAAGTENLCLHATGPDPAMGQPGVPPPQ